MTSRTPSRSFMLAVVLLLPVIANAQSPGVCLPDIDREADKHRAFSERELERHREDMAALDAEIDAMAAGSPDPERLSAGLRRIIEQAVPDDLQAEFIDDPIDLMRARWAPITKRSGCPTDLPVSGYFALFQRSLETALMAPRYEVERRLAAEAVRADEGLVIVAFHANFPFGDLVAKQDGGFGEIRVRPKRSGEHYVVIAARPGTYTWKEVRQGGVTLDIEEEEYDFTVEAGALNYIGMLQFTKYRNFGFNWDRFDRQAFVLYRLENLMPELLDRYPLVNGLDAQDPYTAFYASERKRRNDASD